MKIRRGTILMLLGTMMILGALSLAVYNRYKDNKAGEQAENILSVLESLMAELPESDLEGTEVQPSKSPYWDDWMGTSSDSQNAGNMNGTLSSIEGEESGEAIKEMPFIEIDGIRYIGVLEMPALGITLPVLWEWSDELMEIAPCRYAGDLYAKDMIIMAHNYASHFGRLFDLSVGDMIYYTDINKVRYTYRISHVDVMHRREVPKMFEGEWDLTLFTCVPRSYNRIAVRCVLVSTEKQ